MVAYSDSTAADAILDGIDALRKAREEQAHYDYNRPHHVDQAVRAALRNIGEGVRYAVELLDYGDGY